jgi:hypothetical protein
MPASQVTMEGDLAAISGPRTPRSLDSGRHLFVVVIALGVTGVIRDTVILARGCLLVHRQRIIFRPPLLSLPVE